MRPQNFQDAASVCPSVCVPNSPGNEHLANMAAMHTGAGAA